MYLYIYINIFLYIGFIIFNLSDLNSTHKIADYYICPFYYYICPFSICLLIKINI